MLPEGLLPTQGTIMITYGPYTTPGTYSNNGNGVWTYTTGTTPTTTTSVYVTNYATSNCGSSSVLMVRSKVYTLVPAVGTTTATTPSCTAAPGSYVGSQSQWTPLTLTYNVYASGAYAPVQSYTQSTNSYNVAFSTVVTTTSPGTGSNTPFTFTNPTTQVQKFYATQNDCMTGNMVALGWASYTNIANGATITPTTPACTGTSSTTSGGNARNLANLNMCSVPTPSTAISPSVNYLLVQQFETSTCSGSLGYYYIQLGLNGCHFVSGSTQISVMYTLQAQGSTNSAQNIIQQYWLWTATGSPTTPTCSGSNVALQGSNIFGTTGTSTAATTTTPLTATTGSCTPSGTSYATFSITAQPAAVPSVVTPSYSTFSFATTASCNFVAPSTIATTNLVQLYVPSSTCNQVNWQMSYQSTTASSTGTVGSTMIPSAGTPGALYINNIFTLDSATYGSTTGASITNGQVINAGIPSALPFYSQVSMIGCTNNAAATTTQTTSACFTISQVYTGLSQTNAQSTQFLTYLKGAVQNLLNNGNPTTTSGTYTDVNFISATPVTGSTTNQVTVVYSVQLPSALYGTVWSTTSPFTGNPFMATGASNTMQTYFGNLATASNLVGGVNIYSSAQISSTTVTGTGCIVNNNVPVASPTTTGVLGTNVNSNACFADSEVVTMENGMTKSIAEVQIGDRILSADVEGKTSFSDVVYVPHGANTIEATFVMLTTETGRNVKMTTNHILPAGQCGAAMTVRRADAVSAGDCVMTVEGVEKVMDMVTMQGKGIYTVVTNKEYIVVNGIVATPFGGVNPTLANMYYNLHRLVYAFMPQALMFSGVQQVMDKFASLVL